MSDDKPRDTTPDAPRPDDPTQPVHQPVRAEGPPADQAAPSPEPTPDPAFTAPMERRGFRDRLRRVPTSEGNRTFSLGALIASALAGVIVGGLGAAALHAVTDDGPRHDGLWVQRWDDDRWPGFDGRDGMHGGPGGPGGPGQMLPTTPPDQEGSSS